MGTLPQALSELSKRRDELVYNLDIMGVDASNSDTLDVLIDKVLEIETDVPYGEEGWKPQDDWYDIKSVLHNDATGGYGGRYIQLLTDHEDVTGLSGGLAYRTSDGAFYTNSAGLTHTWNRLQDKATSLRYKVRWLITYTNEPSTAPISDFCLWVYFDVNINGVVQNYRNKRFLQSFEFAPGKNITAVVASTQMLFLNDMALCKVRISTVNVTNCNQMFNNCGSLWDLPQFDLNICTDAGSMFLNCRSLVTVDVINTSSVTNMSNMFSGCYRLRRLPETIDVSNCTTLAGMFYFCTGLRNVPNIMNTSNCTNFSTMFQAVYSLTRLPDVLDVSNGTNLSSMLQDAVSMTYLPDVFNTGSATNITRMFYNTRLLTKVPPNLDFTNVATAGTEVFSQAPYIRGLRVYGMGVSFSMSDVQFLTRDDILFTFNNLKTVSGQTITLGTANRAKLQPGDEAIATGKGWTIA